jgi:hypothetical protein
METNTTFPNRKARTEKRLEYGGELRILALEFLSGYAAPQ